MILCSHLMIFVVLTESHCWATAGSTATDDRPTHDLHYRPTENRSLPGEERIDIRRDEPDPSINGTLAEMFLQRTSDTMSKFLPLVTSADIHSQCFKHTAVYLTQLNDFKIWATKSEHNVFTGHIIDIV